MSNDSNEQGNDTAAQAFQVGDRVRWYCEPWDRNGTVRKLTSLGLVTVLQDGDDVGIMINPRNLTLIARATPAPPAPSEPATPAPTFTPGQRVTILPSDGTTGRVVSLPARMTPTAGYPVALDNTGQVIVFSAKELRATDDPAAPAPAAPVPYTALQRSLDAMDRSIQDARALSTYATEDVVNEALEAIGAAIRALAEDHQARS